MGIVAERRHLEVGGAPVAGGKDAHRAVGELRQEKQWQGEPERIGAPCVAPASVLGGVEEYIRGREHRNCRSRGVFHVAPETKRCQKDGSGREEIEMFHEVWGQSGATMDRSLGARHAGSKWLRARQMASC